MNGGCARNPVTRRITRSESGFRTGLVPLPSLGDFLAERLVGALILLFLFWILNRLRPDLSDDLRIFSARVFRFRLPPLLDLEHPVISEIEPIEQLHVLFKREYFAKRHLVETVPLLFPLTRFDYAGSLSSRTACHEKREQMIVVESGQLLNRIVQRAQGHFIRDYNRSLERFLKVCTPHALDTKCINHIICYRPTIG